MNIGIVGSMMSRRINTIFKEGFNEQDGFEISQTCWNKDAI